ncbi:MAG: hypothetical protein ACP59X_22835 [Solidesulfovibrio sp. DCME]|uniref:hypothetical protein n=1 Tax=Solidesulfovibrio sp. DCME TaxID=3447380 RepID=UPI003D13CFC6
MGRGQVGFVARLERLGLLKYILATLFTGAAFALTAGAFVYEELSRRPPRLPNPPAALLERAGPPPGYLLRAPVSRLVRFTAGAEVSSGFSFYDIAADETPQSLAAKLGRKRLRLSPGRGEACDFAAPLGPIGAREAVAAFIRERSRRCCALSGPVPGQLATYAFAADTAASGSRAAKDAPLAGTAVFSEVDGGLLTLTLRIAAHVDAYRAALEKHLAERYGPASPMGPDGAAWARDGGLVTMARDGQRLVVTAYFAANIDRHAAAAGRLADRPGPRQPQPPARSLAWADAP